MSDPYSLAPIFFEAEMLPFSGEQEWYVSGPIAFGFLFMLAGIITRRFFGHSSSPSPYRNVDDFGIGFLLANIAILTWGVMLDQALAVNMIKVAPFSIVSVSVLTAAIIYERIRDGWGLKRKGLGITP